jgi:valyl-tRNA synthetase
VVTIRDIKTRFKISMEKEVECFYDGNLNELEKIIIKKLAGVKEIKKFTEGKDIFVRHLKSGVLGITFYGIINILEEKNKKLKEIEKLKGILSGIEERLKNEEFIKKAPVEVIENEKNKKIEIKEKINNLLKDIQFIEKRSE